jgi:hypothetical protein
VGIHFLTSAATNHDLSQHCRSNLADRDEPTVAYATPGIHTVPTYLKWMLAYEEPEASTLWLGKAIPRAWLAVGEAPLVARGLTTRYGRVSFTIEVSSSTTTRNRNTNTTNASTSSNVVHSNDVDHDGEGTRGTAEFALPSYVVKANVTIPMGFAAAATQPAGGLRLRYANPNPKPTLAL